MTPIPTPAQAVRVLDILEAWVKRGWTYYPELSIMSDDGRVTVNYTNPRSPADLWHDPDYFLDSDGVNHFDALCQATTVMQVLLAEHPEKS